MTGTVFKLDVTPHVPQRLARLEELANDLWYSWHRPTRRLFATLSQPLWAASGHNPRAFLKSIDQRQLEAAAENPVFLETFDRALAAYDAYHAMPILAHAEGGPLQDGDLIAYFCAEFGFHESLPIYSGGLGILAGDHCKAASDMGLPFVGVGLLYRQGYFHQTLAADGHQQAVYSDSDFDELPISPALDADGQEVRVPVELPGRTVLAKVWEIKVGRVRVILLDTWLELNAAHDRDITHRLYGGDKTTRIEQEMLLGIGGVRALAALGLTPTVWHVNEGHAAFLILERIRSLVAAGLPYPAALEAVAAGVVFTTHTAVPAGHDYFAEDMMHRYFGAWCRELDVSGERLMGLGSAPDTPEFNMTALAVRGSRHHNGVSRIHGAVSARICRHLWPQIEPAENPMDYVTNGVHLQTFLAPEWIETFDRYLGAGWQQRQTDPACWKDVARIPDEVFRGVRRQLKSKLLSLIRDRIEAQHERNQGSPAQLDRLLRLADPDDPGILTIGFGRRFATYKRAALLFQDPQRLHELIGQAGRPVLFLFAGKAHPADEPGQALIRRIAHIAGQPEFEGRVLLVEGYDLDLSRSLVAGVDVWLNNPIYPLEASGTSGMKAAMNGALNLSVLDGWWAEGYDRGEDGIPNGWAIKPAPGQLDEASRDTEEARRLYELLQEQVIPAYYRLGPDGYSPEWIAMAKRSMLTISPRFNVIRMVSEYVRKFYAPAARDGRRYAEGDFSIARDVAQWKAKVRGAWAGVRLCRIDAPQRRLSFGSALSIEVGVHLNGLGPDDVTVEAVFDRPGGRPGDGGGRRYPLQYVGAAASGDIRYKLELAPELSGKLEYRLRLFPTHPELIHPLETGLMIWL